MGIKGRYLVNSHFIPNVLETIFARVLDNVFVYMILLSQTILIEYSLVLHELKVSIGFCLNAVHDRILVWNRLTLLSRLQA